MQRLIRFLGVDPKCLPTLGREESMYKGIKTARGVGGQGLYKTWDLGIGSVAVTYIFPSKARKGVAVQKYLRSQYYK